MTGQLSISGLISGVPAGTIKPGPYSIPANPDDKLGIIFTEFMSGDYTLEIPSWAFGVLIIPPTANTVSLTLKGDSGDIGILISPNQPTFIPFPDDPSASLVITAADDTTGQSQFIFF